MPFLSRCRLGVCGLLSISPIPTTYSSTPISSTCSAPSKKRPLSHPQRSVPAKERLPKNVSKVLPKPVWIRPEGAFPKPLWGIQGGIQFSLWPTAIEGGGDGGPRGLLRIGYPVLEGGKRAGLVNFIAVEPVVPGKGKGYSELEPSAIDGRPGKPMWASVKPGEPPSAGTIVQPDPHRREVEELRVTIRMEKFSNGAHPYLQLSIRSDRPDELCLRTFHEPGSAPMERCILTATMGNFARTRLLHLKGEPVDSRRLYEGYEDVHFTKDEFFGLDRMRRNRRGDVVVPYTTDETAPESVQPFAHDPIVWKWRGVRVTQYWKKEAGEAEKDLQVRVNARRTYWMSRQPIPGGIAFENVEFQEPYQPGEMSIFGITRRSPEELWR